MNKLDTIEFKMFQIVLDILLKFKYIWQNNAIIVRCYDELLYVVRMLSKANEAKQANHTEITKYKKKFRKTYIKNLFNIKKALLHYYTIQEMKVEAALFEYPISKFTLMTDDALYLEAINIMDRAALLEAELLPLGVTAEQITQTGLETVEFLNLIKSLDYAIKQTTVTNARIKELIKIGKAIFSNELDVAVSMYNLSFLDFTTIYLLGRKRVLAGNHGTYKVVISGKLIDAITKLVLVGVKVVAGAKNITVYTDKDGKYKISIFKKDITTITFSFTSKYIDSILQIPTKYKRSKIKLNAELVPIKEDRYPRGQYYID